MKLSRGWVDVLDFHLEAKQNGYVMWKQPYFTTVRLIVPAKVARVRAEGCHCIQPPVFFHYILLELQNRKSFNGSSSSFFFFYILSGGVASFWRRQQLQCGENASGAKKSSKYFFRRNLPPPAPSIDKTHENRRRCYS